jgi:putative ABC transport system permease protein
MIVNHLKIALRLGLRNRVFSLINLSGLAIGLTAFLAISLYVADELSFDRFHQHSARIYQVQLRAEFDGQVMHWPTVPNLLVPTAIAEIPEIEKAVRLFHHNFSSTAFVNSDFNKSAEEKMYWADPGFFEIFSLPLISGNPRTVLDKPNTVVLSEAAALRYFGAEDPVGKTIKVDNRISLEVTGVYRNPPANSLLQMDLIGSFTSGWWGSRESESWGNASFQSYLLLHPSANPRDVENKLNNLAARSMGEDQWFTLSIMPIGDLHLHAAHLTTLLPTQSDMSRVRILIVLAMFILLLACINYTNMATARSQKRQREIGVNKTLGATRGVLSRQFLTETALLTLMAMMAAVVMYLLLQPVLNNLTQKQIGAGFLFQGSFWGAFFLLWLLITLLSGSYPALYLSSITPALILRTQSVSARGNVGLRKGLVVFQYGISILLIICTLVLYQQLDYIRKRDLGYSPVQVLAVSTTGAENIQQISAFSSRVAELPDVRALCRTQSFPGRGASGRNLPHASGSGEGIPLITNRAEPGVLEVLGVPLLAGRDLPEKEAGDTTVQILLNLSAVKYLGWTPEEAIGRRLHVSLGPPAEIIGVMGDFNYASLTQPIGAYGFHNARTEGLGFLLVKIDTPDLPSALKRLESTYAEFIPSAFEYTFLDQHLENLYRRENSLAKVVLTFSVIAILIASLGLYALAAFTAEQRTREIGIRKTMGARSTQILAMLTSDYIRLMLLAFAISIPLSWIFMKSWLEQFAYRVDLAPPVFLAAGALVLTIAWLTVAYESVKSSLGNPVDALRTE